MSLGEVRRGLVRHRFGAKAKGTSRQVEGPALWLGHVGDVRDHRLLFDVGIEAVVDLARVAGAALALVRGWDLGEGLAWIARSGMGDVNPALWNEIRASVGDL